MPYPRNIEEIIGRFPLLPLDAGGPDPSVAGALEDAMLERLFGPVLIRNTTSARLCQAGLWLLAGHLDACHVIVQSVGTVDASAWHAVMHRREGDFSNSRHWYARAGEHGIFPKLLEQARALSGTDPAFAALVSAPAWRPEAFVECCRAELARPSGTDICRRIQHAEWRLLFAWCYGKATEDL